MERIYMAVVWWSNGPSQRIVVTVTGSSVLTDMAVVTVVVAVRVADVVLNAMSAVSVDILLVIAGVVEEGGGIVVSVIEAVTEVGIVVAVTEEAEIDAAPEVTPAAIHAVPPEVTLNTPVTPNATVVHQSNAPAVPNPSTEDPTPNPPNASIPDLPNAVLPDHQSTETVDHPRPVAPIAPRQPKTAATTAPHLPRTAATTVVHQNVTLGHAQPVTARTVPMATQTVTQMAVKKWRTVTTNRQDGRVDCYLFFTPL